MKTKKRGKHNKKNIKDVKHNSYRSGRVTHFVSHRNILCVKMKSFPPCLPLVLEGKWSVLSCRYLYDWCLAIEDTLTDTFIEFYTHTCNTQRAKQRPSLVCFSSSLWWLPTGIAVNVNIWWRAAAVLREKTSVFRYYICLCVSFCLLIFCVCLYVCI